MASKLSRQALLCLLAAITLTTVLGSIHAFSVFLIPLETLLDAGRAQISLIYSGALICLTISVLFGYKIYPVLSPPILALVACLVAAAGIVLAGYSDSLWMVVLGYSVLFGAANGVGYGFALQISAQAMPQRQGFAMGTVTAFYALGATISPSIFSSMLARGGVSLAMTVAGVIFAVAGVVAWALLRRSGISFSAESTTSSGVRPGSHFIQILLWFGYGSGSLAGLMIIGHATGIVVSAGGSHLLAVVGAMVIAFGSMLGGLLAGVLADRLRIITLLTLLPLLSALALVFALFNNEALLLLGALTIVGFSYGAIIAVYPVAVINIFGSAASSRIYGRVFTSWGFVGLLGPWLAGYFYDSSGNYTLAISVALASSMLSILVAGLLAKQISVDEPDLRSSRA
ncbi:MAG: OFA family oxalate/formate antiporter-like MFS transporter [Gammaproteobacteria bacterium]|jgi:OFA family oxalate/formate antiporter-like MFS transporter